MKIALCLGPHGFQQEHSEAFAAGIRAVGDEPVFRPDPVTRIGADAVICWGWRKGQKLRATGANVLCAERGYLGDRSKWTALGWNGLNGLADFCIPKAVSNQRFDQHHSMQPWRRKAGEYVLIMGQVPGDMSLRGKDLRPWYVRTAKEAADAYGLPVFIRPHPVAVKRGLWRSPGLPVMAGSLDEALCGAHVVIVWNSNSAVDAVIAGVPSVVMGDGAMAAPVCGRRIGDRLMPDRKEWAARLAWCQWTLEEIASGQPWALLREHIRS